MLKGDLSTSFLVPSQNHFLEHDLKLPSDHKKLTQVVSQFESEVVFL